MMILGIDVSKSTIDVALLKDEFAKPRHKVFSNDGAGHHQLVAWLREQGAPPETAPVQACLVQACLEATGTYGEAVALALFEVGHRVSVVNPAQVRDFGKSELKRTKTDKADAQVIARFCQSHRPAPWSPPAPELRALQGLVRRVETLEEMKQMEENRRGSGGVCAVVRASLDEHILYLQGQIEKTRRQIEEHIDQNPGLRSQAKLLESIPGIGAVTAAVILAEVGEMEHFKSARQVAAFAGLVPKIRESGSSVRGKPRLSKVGSPRLRKCLYFPAMTALRFNPLIKALGLRLSAQGKPKMLILGAAMRKLLHLAYGVLKSGKPFDANFAANTSFNA